MEAIGHAIGSVGIFVLVPVLLCWCALSVALPVMCWSVVRNVARTRRAVERIADALSSADPAGRRGGLGL